LERAEILNKPLKPTGNPKGLLWHRFTNTFSVEYYYFKLITICKLILVVTGKGFNLRCIDHYSFCLPFQMHLSWFFFFVPGLRRSSLPGVIDPPAGGPLQGMDIAPNNDEYSLLILFLKLPRRSSTKSII